MKGGGTVKLRVPVHHAETDSFLIVQIPNFDVILAEYSYQTGYWRESAVKNRLRITRPKGGILPDFTVNFCPVLVFIQFEIIEAIRPDILIFQRPGIF